MPALIEPTRTAPAADVGEPDYQWQQVRERFLSAIGPALRPRVVALLSQPRHGGRGLRSWLRNLVWDGSRLPVSIPDELVQVYLDDHEALPLHDCSGCGLAVPVRLAPDADFEEAPAREYFPLCPNCGSLTGLFAYYSGPGRRCAAI